MDWLPLIAVTVMFILSLTGAVVLFRFLKSTALIKRKDYRAGGALAGFLLIFATLHFSFNAYSENFNKSRPVVWTIMGTVKKVGASVHDTVEIRHIPDRPRAISKSNGSFSLDNVVQHQGEGFPRIYFEALDGSHHPIDMRISEANADIDRESRLITLKGVVRLSQIALEEAHK